MTKRKHNDDEKRLLELESVKQKLNIDRLILQEAVDRKKIGLEMGYVERTVDKAAITLLLELEKRRGNRINPSETEAG